MSPEPAPVPYRQIVTELAGLCRARRTGTLFIATTDNQSARIGLREGEISSLAFRNQRGLEALINLRKIVAGRINFTDAVIDPPPSCRPLPSPRRRLPRPRRRRLRLPRPMRS